MIKLEYSGHCILIREVGSKYHSEIDGNRVAGEHDTPEEAIADAKDRCEVIALQEQVTREMAYFAKRRAPAPAVPKSTPNLLKRILKRITGWLD